MGDTAYILVTGSRDEKSTPRITYGLSMAHSFLSIEAKRLQIAEKRPIFKHVCLFHGNAPGLDKNAARIAETVFGWDTVAFDADWENLKLAAGSIRNGEMTDAIEALLDQNELCCCVSFPRIGSKGTWDCAKRASKRILNVIIPWGLK